MADVEEAKVREAQLQDRFENAQSQNRAILGNLIVAGNAIRALLASAEKLEHKLPDDVKAQAEDALLSCGS